MRLKLLKVSDRYRKGQVDSAQKLTLLWQNVMDAHDVEAEGHVGVDIQDPLFDDGSTTVTFMAFVRKRKK